MVVQGGTSTMLDFADHLCTTSSVSVRRVLAPVRRVWFALLAGSMGAPEGFWICLALSPVALGWEGSDFPSPSVVSLGKCLPQLLLSRGTGFALLKSRDDCVEALYATLGTHCQHTIIREWFCPVGGQQITLTEQPV